MKLTTLEIGANTPIVQTKKYLYHCIPAGATPVPLDPKSNKRVSGGYKFFYNGWQLENQSEHNCRFGATRDNFFQKIDLQSWTLTT